MAKKEDFQFLSADKRTQVHGVKWTPEDGSYRAILQITHGMQEYIMRYQEFAEYMTERGFLVVGHDHIGHGDSIRSNEDLGFFTEDDQSNVLVEDIHQLRCRIQKENPGIPYFILGHSMGSYLLRKYITLHGNNLRGVILVGTGSMPDAQMKMGMFLCRFIAKFFGWHYRSKFVKKLSFAGPYKVYDVTGKNLENNWLTKDLEIAGKYYQDSKCNYGFTISGYYGLMETVYYDNQPEHIAKVPKKLPLFLMSGDKDPVGNMGAGVKKAYHQYEEAGIEDITWKLYENDRHELLNETDRKDAYKEIYTWINVRKTT